MTLASRRASTVGLWLLCLTFAPSVAAQNNELDPTFGESEQDSASHTRTAARTLAQQGSQAFERQEYETALDLFQRAGALVPAPTIQLMEARTLVQLGRWVQAADKYASIGNLSPEQQQNPTFAMASEAARSELSELTPRIPTLKVLVIAPGRPELQIKVDDRPLPSALVGVENPLNPGAHRVEVVSDNVVEVREVMLSEADRQELVIELQPAVNAEPEPPPAAAPRAAPEPKPPAPGVAGDTNTWAWIATGAGVAGLAIGSVAGILALDRQATLDDHCDPGCPAGFADDIRSFRRSRTLSYLGMSLGTIGLFGGGYLFWQSSKEEHDVGLWLYPGGASVRGRF